MNKKINAFKVSLITIGAVAIYFMPVVDVIMLTLLMMMFSCGGIFGVVFLENTARDKFVEMGNMKLWLYHNLKGL